MRRMHVYLLFLSPVILSAQVSLVSHTVQGCSVNCGNSVGAHPPVSTNSIDTRGASLIAVCTASYSGVNVPPTDSANNSWTQANSQNENGDARASLWFALYPKTSAEHTFTLRGAGSALAVSAFRGVSSGPDQKSQSQGKSPLASGTLNPSNPNELVLSCFSAYTGSGYAIKNLTMIDSLPPNGEYFGSEGIAAAYQVQSGATAVNPTWTGAGAATVSASFYSVLSPAPLSVASTSLPEGFAGTPYRAQGNPAAGFALETAGGVGPFHWAITSGSLPAGLSMDDSGIISGTPSVPGKSSLTVSVKDANSRVASRAYSIDVAGAPLKLGPGTCTGAALDGTQYRAHVGCQLSASGGTEPYSFGWASVAAPFCGITTVGSYNSVAVPEGMTLNPSTGTLSSALLGARGVYRNVKFILCDAAGWSATLNVTFNISGSISPYGYVELFPKDTIFHQRVDSLPVDTGVHVVPPFYPAYLAAPLKFDHGNNIPIIVVPYNQPMVAVSNTASYANRLSKFTSGPIPTYAPVEGTMDNGGDRHIIVEQQAGGGRPAQLWECWEGVIANDGSVRCATTFHHPNLGSTGARAYEIVSGQDQGGTTDAAGLPIAPFLATMDEVIGNGTVSAPQGVVEHPLRFTVNHMLGYYVWPGTAHAGVASGSCKGGYQDSNKMLLQSAPPTEGCKMFGPAGEIYRLKASTEAPGCLATSPQAKILYTALQQYGMILADNGRSGFMQLASDARWNMSDLACLNKLHLSDFEPVNVSGVAADLSPLSAGGVRYRGPITTYRVIPPSVSSASSAGTNLSKEGKAQQ